MDLPDVKASRCFVIQSFTSWFPLLAAGASTFLQAQDCRARFLMRHIKLARDSFSEGYVPTREPVRSVRYVG
jgi:hypothetical protein